MLHRDYGSHKYSSKDSQYKTFDNRLKQEGSIIASNKTSNAAQTSIACWSVSESNPRRKPDARETIDTADLETF
jgi:hypothetical protein